MGVRGHTCVAEEVGPNIFDVHCYESVRIGRPCRFGFQGFTWQGQAAAAEMASRHYSAVEQVTDNPNWEASIDAPAIRRELYGYTGAPAGV